MNKLFPLILPLIFTIFFGCASTSSIAPVQEVQPDIHSLNESAFWSLIERANVEALAAGQATGFAARFEEALETELRRCSPEALISYVELLAAYEKELYSWLHYSAAWLICGKVEPKQFLYFRNRLIFLGKAAYGEIRFDADRVAVYITKSFDPMDWEKVSLIGRSLLESTYGSEAAKSVESTGDYNIAGSPLTAQRVRELLPTLWTRYRGR